MPNGPVEMIEYDPKGNVLFAATDVGVFDHKDGDALLVQDQRRAAAGAGARRQALRRRQDAVRGDVRALASGSCNLSTDATDGGGAGRGGSVPATLALTLGTPAPFGAVHAGRGQGLHRDDDRERDLAPPVTRR